MAALLASLGVAGQAWAQAPTEAPPAGGPRTIDEIVVTAQKRTQNLQDVPIVVTAVNAQQLQDAGVRDIKDLTIVTPGLTVTTTSSNAITSARIRGVGTVGDNVGLESSVGVVIDGVYRPRNGVAFSDLGDLERIEVLKGPQGTLFGKNTSAGVINVITKRPEFEYHANAEAIASNYNGFGASVSLTGPIMADKLAGRLFLAGRARDGYYAVVGGPTTNDQNFWTSRGQLLFRPTDDIDINIAADYTERNERCCGSVQILNAAGPTAVLNSIVPGAIANPPRPGDFDVYLTHNDLKKVVDKGVQAQVDWSLDALGGATLTSITGLRDWKQSGGTDTDATLVDILYSPAVDMPNTAYIRFKQFSQELRLAGDTGRLNWLVGGFYTDEKLTQHTRLLYGSQFEQYANGLFAGTLPLFTGRPATGGTFVSGEGQNDTYKQHEHGFALFTNNTYKITDALELTVGARYTWEKKKLNTIWDNTDNAIGCTTALNRAAALGGPIPASGALVQAGGLMGAGPYSLLCGTFQNPAFDALGTNYQHLKEDKLTGTVKVAYRFTPEVLTYVSYARGYKAGGFNLDRIAAPTQTVARVPAAPVLDTRFLPETVDSYEIGMKNTLFNRTLLANATVFYQKYHDFQLNTFNGLVFNVTSVPTVISRGVDADFVWFTPIEGLSAQGGVTYAETYYPRSTEAVLGFPPPPPIGNQRLPTSRLSLAPLWSVSLAGTYERPITDNLVARIAVNGKYTSSYNTGSNLDPVKNQKDLTLVNGRIGIGPEDRSWQFEIWGQNLFDKTYTQVAYDSVAQTGSYSAFLGMPRTYGATLRFSY
jgi:outer membrane receptor protein involved in Fe transport